MSFMESYILGAISLACLVVAAFLVKFWVSTRDRLFLTFAASFLLLGITRLIRGWLESAPEEHQYIYWLRLLAYLLILVAIVDKNRPRSPSAGPAGN